MNETRHQHSLNGFRQVHIRAAVSLLQRHRLVWSGMGHRASFTHWWQRCHRFQNGSGYAQNHTTSFANGNTILNCCVGDNSAGCNGITHQRTVTIVCSPSPPPLLRLHLHLKTSAVVLAGGGWSTVRISLRALLYAQCLLRQSLSTGS